MVVGNCESIGGIAFDLWLAILGVVIRNLIFGYGIDDFSSAILILIQSGELGCPLIVFTLLNSHAFLLRAISQKVDGYGFRPDTILIIIVYPDLLDFDFNEFRRVAVGDFDRAAQFLLFGGY